MFNSIITQPEEELKGKYPWEDNTLMSLLKGGSWVLKVEKSEKERKFKIRGGAEEKDFYVTSCATFLLSSPFLSHLQI